MKFKDFFYTLAFCKNCQSFYKDIFTFYELKFQKKRPKIYLKNDESKLFLNAPRLLPHYAASLSVCTSCSYSYHHQGLKEFVFSDFNDKFINYSLGLLDFKSVGLK